MSEIYTFKCLECNNGTIVSESSGHEQHEPCLTCHGHDMCLMVECEKCEGTGHTGAKRDGKPHPAYKCTCTNGLRPLTEDEVEELANQMTGYPSKRKYLRLYYLTRDYSDTFTFQGSPVTIGRIA